MSEKRILAENIVRKLRKKGYEAYFAGGCVRDMVRGKEPSDFDIVTEASTRAIQKIFKRTIPVGVKFGILLVIEEGKEFQVATFRAEGGLKEDVLKRDFTINGLIFEPLKKEIKDFVEGREDIEKKVVQTIGSPEKRFREDGLRLIRAVRFAVNLEFSLEKKTGKAISKETFRIKEVSPERIRGELIKIMSGPHPDKGLEMLEKTGILKEVMPEVSKMKGVSQPEEFHPEGDVFEHTRLVLEKLKEPSVTLAFSSLLHDVGKPPTYEVSDRIRFPNHQEVGARMAESILRRLKFPSEEVEKIVSCVRNHMNFMNAPKMRESKLKRLMMRPTFLEELELHRIDCLSSHRDLKIWNYLEERYQEYKREPKKREPLLRGRDLLKMGFSPGPLMGKIVREAEDLQLEGRLKTKKEAREWVRKNFPQKG
jgi:poly(A) polymerase